LRTSTWTNRSREVGPVRSEAHDVLPEGKGWNKPFNDAYINYSRDGLPIHTRISDIAQRIAAIAEQAILREGGRKGETDGQTVYYIPESR
jgi:hypothetical protein